MLEEHFNSLSKIVLVIEYDGRRYYGFQWQQGRPTIQGCLEDSIKKVTGETRRVVAASRTDTGVHALFQVVSFRSYTGLSQDIIVKALNYYLPRDIAVRSAARVTPDFNVRKDALGREYEYQIYSNPIRSPLLEGFAYQVAYKLDIEAMNRACSLLEGENDLASFAASAGRVKSTLRKIYRIGFELERKIIIFRIKQNSFLMHQVRNMLGFLMGIGTNKRTIEDLKQVLNERKPGLAGPAVPPYGLCLTRVYYPEDLELKYENLFNKSQ